MRKKILQLIVILVAFCQMQAVAQTSRITGRVTGPDNNPVPGASVTISGSNEATFTDADGNFAILAPADASLLINSIGFKDQVVKISGRSVLNVALSAGQSTGLEEVIVTGYTSQRKKDIIGSVAVVDVAALKSTPASSALQALQGQAAGVDIINNGSPGGGSSIFIRGINGFSPAPLILIDGVQGGDINDVPSDDIESIQILKDAGSAAVYGARGGNGVVIITTKRGKSGRPRVDYEAYFNYQIPKKSAYDVLNTQQYVDIFSKINPTSPYFGDGNVPDYLWRNGGVTNGWGKANEGAPEVNPDLYNFDYRNAANTYVITKLNQGTTNMYDEVFDPALMMRHNITASGGNDRANYLLSFGYLDQQGTLMNTFLKRYNVRINSEYKLTKNIRIGENINVFYKNNPSVANGPNATFNPINESMQWFPMMPVYDIGGNFATPWVGGTGDHDVNGFSNAKASMHYTDNNRRRFYGIQGNAYLEFDFLRNFLFRTNFGGNINNYYHQAFNYNYSPGGAASNELTDQAGFNSTWQWTNSLSYKKAFGKHNISAFAALEAIETKGRDVRAYGQNYFLTNYDYLILNRAGRTDHKRPENQNFGSTSLYSQLAKIDYQYNDKYLVGFTIRRDGFSNFGTDNKFGVFPSVALGWRISEESFMTNVAWVSDLKIRGSYGEMGHKEGIPQGNSFSTYTQSPGQTYYAIGGGNTAALGFSPGRFGNYNTEWETDILWNIGFDASLFNNKLDLSIEYYQKKMDGMLSPLARVGVTGEANPPIVNIGNVENKGIDIAATYRERLSKDFNFSVGLNFTAYKNEITGYRDPGYSDEGVFRYAIGQPISSFYGYKVLGVFKDQEQVDKHAIQTGKGPGTYIFQDTDGDGEITPEDRVFNGSSNPDFTMGINLAANFKNFDFSAILYTSQGAEIYNGALEYTGNWSRRGNKSTRVLRAWTPENTVTDVPRNEMGSNFSIYQNNTQTSAYIEDGSFIRLRSVQIGYNVKSGAITRAGLNRLRFYVQGTNLFMITNYTGADPEVAGGTGFRGFDTGGVYKQDLGLVFGLNVGF